MDLEVPLNRLKFGQEDGAGINARVTGRKDDIPALAAHINARGQIENLLVRDCGEGFYSVANGNRRLAALHMIYGETSAEPVRCTLREVNEDEAFEDSLATAVTAKQLHPVDQYEAFARLDERGKTNEEIARQYGLTVKEVRQQLALGRLSPKIRQEWRDGAIKAEVARAFTLSIDHKTQDSVFTKLQKGGYLWESHIKKELGAGETDKEVAQLVDFVGADAYRAAGGIVTEDLFGSSHIISDVPLLNQMARNLLDAKCEQLKAEGWGWSELEANLPHGARFWPASKPKELIYEGDEKERLEKAQALLQAAEDSEGFDNDEQDRLTLEIEQIETSVRSRSFGAKNKAKLGCIVDVEEGRLVILYGVKKPAQAALSSASSGSSDAEEDDRPAGKGAGAKKPEEPEVSQALLHRLSLQLTEAAATALIQDEQLALSILIAGFGCYDGCGVKVSVNGLGSRGERGLLGAEEMIKALPLATRLKPAERVTLLAQVAANALDFQNRSLNEDDRRSGTIAICNTIDSDALNAALRGVFDAKDYFAGVNKALCLKAIQEAMGADMARQQSKNPKGDIAAFAIENVPVTGWLPPQLRAKGYDGPPNKAKATAAAPAGKKKKPASAKKTAKKTSAKKRKG